MQRYTDPEASASDLASSELHVTVGGVLHGYLQHVRS